MQTIKLECLENPGPDPPEIIIRSCLVSDVCPNLGIVRLPVENVWRIYYIPKGLWAYQGSEEACHMFLRAVEEVDLNWPSRRSSECLAAAMEQANLI